jgi:SpoVK/Ycf46/Vps4 family AAA+-type ATPase
LPTYSITSRVDDDVVLGYWLTGGAGISVKSFRRLSQMMSWLGRDNLRDVIGAAGLGSPGGGSDAMEARRPDEQEEEAAQADKTKEPHGDSVELPASAFELPGRPELAVFFNEHVVDIVRNRERYQALGIRFPSAIVLCGPPGCGKTFAVERLVEYLGWPSFEIDASSVASPYIHDTSKKVAQMFDKAMESAPSVLIMDEMDAFLADREGGVNQYRVEEVAEFLRRIPEAVKNDVLIIAMTNRIDMIDPAVVRRGRFDHIIEVGYPSADEVRSLLGKLLSDLPRSPDVNAEPLVAQLAGRPLSDVAFVVREAARLAARAGKDNLDQESLKAAIAVAPAREREGQVKRRIGFI